MSTLKGTVKWFNGKKGFGFIEREDKEKDAFVHASAVKAAGMRYLNEGDKLEGMKLPLKCWIHTHPFGRAYFSGTDKKTIDIWRPRLRSAIVLGLHEHQTWFRNSNDVIHYQYKVTTKKKYVPYTEGFDLREEE